MMKVFCHGFECKSVDCVLYTGLRVINDVEEVVLYSDKEKKTGGADSRKIS